ncbi:MAG: recombinase family protein [Candidatus Paceibacterota bacterium]|jgi:DNA invertase Pin-like site-specific DNA recombinase
MKNIYGYVRVSTRSQNYDLQVEGIQAFCKMREYNLVKVFADKATGKDMDREQYQKMIEMLIDLKNPQSIDAVVVTKLDRVGRNVNDLVGFVKKLETNHIDFATTLESVDTTTSQGRLFFHFIAAIAEYERELINERTEAGLKKYMANGGRMGKPKIKINMDEVNELLRLEIPKTVIARKLKISLPTLYDRINEEKAEALNAQRKKDIETSESVKGN